MTPPGAGDSVGGLLEAAIALHASGRKDEAERALRQALQLDPRHPEVRLNLAVLDIEGGRHEEALALLAALASEFPGSPLVHRLTGDAHARAGRPREALAHFDIVTKTDRSAALLERIGRASLAAGDAARAAQAFREQLLADPRSRDAAFNLSVSLETAGERGEAKAALARAVGAGHGDAEVLGFLAHLHSRDCDWDGVDGVLPRLRTAALVPSAHPAFPQYAIYFDGIDAADQRVWAENWVKARMPAPATAAQRTPHASRSTPRASRLRIGYLGGDFNQHAMMLLMAGMLEAHDRTRFDVAAYSYGPSDGTPLERRVRSAFDRFVDIGALDNPAAAARIRDDRIDVLIDLGGHTRGARMEILAHRPAPLQGHFLGLPATTGASFVDFYVADAFTVPRGGESHFTERIARMPVCYLPSDAKRALPAAMPRADCGLPADNLVFCSFNQGLKITRRVFARWCALLEAVPGSILWLVAQERNAEANLRAFAARRGIHAARIVFAPRVGADEHLARLRSADLALDTFPCTSHTTASDVAWAGVPMVTVAGSTFASRVAASVLTAIGCLDQVFADDEAAFRAALALARDGGARARARRHLVEMRQSPFFDSTRFARDFESLLEAQLAGA